MWQKVMPISMTVTSGIKELEDIVGQQSVELDIFKGKV